MTSFDKTALKQQLLDVLDEDIRLAIASAQAAQEDASHEDNQPENQYDTLSLEAAYLAHGQSERIRGLQQDRIRVSQWPVNAQEDGAIHLGSLVVLSNDETNSERYIWITPIGGKQLQVEEGSILLISPDAPLARKLGKLEVGDDIHFNQSQAWYIDKVI